MPLTQLPELGWVHIVRERIARGQLTRSSPGAYAALTKVSAKLVPLCDRAIRPDQPMLEIEEQPPASSSTLAALPYANASAAPEK
jgi:hypothetical protein